MARAAFRFEIPSTIESPVLNAIFRFYSYKYEDGKGDGIIQLFELPPDWENGVFTYFDSAFSYNYKFNYDNKDSSVRHWKHLIEGPITSIESPNKVRSGPYMPVGCTYPTDSVKIVEQEMFAIDTVHDMDVTDYVNSVLNGEKINSGFILKYKFHAPIAVRRDSEQKDMGSYGGEMASKHERYIKLYSSDHPDIKYRPGLIITTSNVSIKSKPLKTKSDFNYLVNNNCKLRLAVLDKLVDVITIIDSKGRVVQRFNKNLPALEGVELDISELSSGVYFCNISSKSSSNMVSFIKE